MDTQIFANYQQVIDVVFERGAHFSASLLLALVIFFVGKRLARWVTDLVVFALQSREAEVELIGFMQSLIYWGLLAMIIVAALGQLGVKTASFVAVIGAAGLAIGLALQGSLSNFAAGVLILVLRPFRVDDYVEVAGESGSVTGIRAFTTELRTPDNKCVIIPNARVLDSNITNHTSTGRRRVDMEFAVGYADDLEQVKEILQRLVTQDPRVLSKPEPVIAVSSLGESSVNLLVRPWVKTDDYWDFHWAMLERVKQEFDARGIEIPFPQRTVHTKS